jgi:hypothetical protein
MDKDNQDTTTHRLRICEGQRVVLLAGTTNSVSSLYGGRLRGCGSQKLFFLADEFGILLLSISLRVTDQEAPSGNHIGQPAWVATNVIPHLQEER